MKSVKALCRAVAARGFSSPFRPQIYSRLSGSAYSAARSFSVGGPFHGADRRPVGVGQSAFSSLGMRGHKTRHTVHTGFTRK